MKTTSKIIIYDNSCPMCSLYTNAFVKTGFIDKEGRKEFSTIDPALLGMIDTKRCSNEIPVIDINTKQVWYGIDGLLEILGQKMPVIKIIGNQYIAKWFLQKLYKLISYNRRVIVATSSQKGNFDCTPDFNYRYRFLFMFIFLVFNTAMLHPLYGHVFKKSFIHTSIIQLQAAHFALVAVNILIALTLAKNAAFEYLGQVNMLALLSILLIIPLSLMNKYFLPSNTITNSIYLVVLTIFIIKEYYRRMIFAGVIPTYWWIVIINTASIVCFLTYLIS